MMVRVFALLLVVVSCMCPASATALEHYWSHIFGDGSANSYTFATDVAFDPAGNVILGGDFITSVDFGGGVLTAPGGYQNDLYIAKFNPGGEHIWSMHVGDSDAQWVGSIAVDKWGNIAVTGLFYGTIDFGGGPLSAWDLDTYVAKLDGAGNHLWSRNFKARAGSVAFDPLGNLVVTMSSIQTLDFGGGPLTTTGIDIFVASFTPDGTHIWSDVYGGAGLHYPRSVAADPSGNIILAGEFDGTLDFGGGPLTSVGPGEIYLAKLDPSGNHLWSKDFGDASDHAALDVAVDPAGNVIFAGDFTTPVNFGGGTLTSAGSEDIFVARFDTAGTHLWSKRFGDNFSQVALGVAVDEAGDVLITGAGSGLNFGGGPIATGFYIARFNAGGGHVSSESFGAGCGTALDTDPWGNVVVAGNTGGTVDFGGGPLVALGESDAGLAKFSPTATAVPQLHTAVDLDVRAHPNPFNPTTTIAYTLPTSGRVSIRVFDTTGRLVELLVNNQYRTAGAHTVAYQAQGSSGVYFVRIDAGGNTRVRKIVLLK